MKKEFLSIVCVLSVFICFSCSHSTSKKPDVVDPDPDKTEVTAQELIMKIPDTFEEFQSQAKVSSRVIAAEIVSLENLEPVKSWDYTRVTEDDESPAVLFLNLLKNAMRAVINFD